MTAFFPTFFLQQLTANPNLLNPGNVRVVLFRTAPSLDGGTAQYLGVRTVADLEAILAALINDLARPSFRDRELCLQLHDHRTLPRRA